MTRGEATAVLGAALMVTSGRGFDIAIYDARGEVVFRHGRVMAWSAPVAAKPR